MSKHRATARRKNTTDALREVAREYRINGSGVQHQLRFIDLFCGIGGFRIAFERAGCECVFSSDWNDKAQETYAANFGEKPHGDIYGVPDDSIPQHNILCAGFPCQPFSIAGVSKKLSLGKKHGFEDKEQGNLFFKLAELIDHRRPDAFVLENVKHLQRHDKGNTFRIIWETLTDHLKYHVYHRVIDAQSVVPQHRERIFLVGFRDRRHFEFPEYPREGPKLESILDAEVPEKYTLTDHLWNYLQAYAAKHKAAGNGFGFGLVTGKGIARTLSARYYKDGSEILISQGSRKNPRRLTPRECARLMGYPADFKIPVSDTQAYKQFGNSVVVPVVERIAKAVVEALQRPVDYRKDLVLELAEREGRTPRMKPKSPMKPVQYKVARKSK
ncbi:MAG: DNA (cytosine-5-)-methyltransferase [Verrucomicrobiae bacterium]|nr:DNA (cytosine-5-)-methyltransferase [Verrucomicrobiae bacterium]